MVGLIDGSLSTLAPIFSVALISHKPFYAFVAGLATSIGAGISMAFSEGLSDTGELTGRGNPLMRGGITGIGTFIGGILHSLPFLIPTYHVGAAHRVRRRRLRARRARRAARALLQHELHDLARRGVARRRRDRGSSAPRSAPTA